MKSFVDGWHVIYTRPRHEKKVVNKLESHEIRSFLPTIKKVQNWWDRKKVIDFPLFPSYVFAYLLNSENYYEALKAEGVLYFVRNGSKIATVSDELILNIQLAVQQAGEIVVSTDTFRLGQQVYIREGSLAGLKGEIVEVNQKQKVLIRVGLLQRNLIVSIESQNLVKAFDYVHVA